MSAQYPACSLPASIEQQLVGTDRPVVGRVVQDRGVGAAGDDGRVSRRRRAAAAEDAVDQRLDLVLVHARPCRAHRFPVCLGGDRDGLAQARDLGRVLAQPELVQDLAGIAHDGGTGARPRPLRVRTTHGGPETTRPGVVAAEGQEDLRGLAEPARQLLLQRVERMRDVRAVRLDRPFDAGTRSDPEGLLGVAWPDEQREGLLGAGREEGDGVGLRKPRDVTEVAVLAKRIVRVARAEMFRGGGQQHHSLAHGGEDASPPGGVERAVVVGEPHPALL